MTEYRAILVGENWLFLDSIRKTLTRGTVSIVTKGHEVADFLDAEPDKTPPEFVILHIASARDSVKAANIVGSLRERFPHTKLVILADACVAAVLPNFVCVNVGAILLTEISSGMLEHSLELVLSNHRLFPAYVMSSMTADAHLEPAHQAAIDAVAGILGDDARSSPMHFAEPPNDSVAEIELPLLTGREIEVVYRLANGLSNKAIARKLNITEGTVKVHVKGLFRKISASNRTQLAIWALHHLYPEHHRERSWSFAERDLTKATRSRLLAAIRKGGRQRLFKPDAEIVRNEQRA